MASKSDKRRCLSQSAASDWRFSGAVGQKNEGEHYTRYAAAKVNLSAGKHHATHAFRSNHIAELRRKKINTPEFKKKRMANKKLRSALRHRKEKQEGTTYESNCALLTEPAVQRKNMLENQNNAVHTVFDEESDEAEAIILLDLETSGLSRDCDILQIAAKSNGKSFSSYVSPVGPIAVSASNANGLTAAYGELMFHGEKVTSMPLRIVIFDFLRWLESLNKRCFIVTHNLSHDGPILYKAFITCNLIHEFSLIVSGFTDSLTVHRRVTKRRGRGECSIAGLCNFFNISCIGAHNAEADVRILSQTLHAAKVTHNIILENSKSWDQKNTLFYYIC